MHVAARFSTLAYGVSADPALAQSVPDAMLGDLREPLRRAHAKLRDRTTCIVDRRALQPTLEFGACAGFDAARRHKETRVHLAVDTLGYPLAVQASAASAQDRTRGPLHWKSAGLSQRHGQVGEYRPRLYR